MTDWIVRPVLGDATAEQPVHRLMQAVGLLCCAAITAFVLWTLAVGRFPPQVQYGTVLTFGLIAIFLLRPGPLARDGVRTVPDILFSLALIAATLFAGIYYLQNYEEIAALREGLPNQWDLLCYAAGTTAVLFGAHRAEGWVLSVVVLCAVGYLMFGQYLPGILHHRPFPLEQVLEISFSYQGIFGVAFAAVVNVVYIFVILGVALRISGAGQFFNDFAYTFTRRRRSGPAQCAIVGSAMFGSINGSAPANVAATGVLTIPMMRRAGYDKRFAGGVEATASCVGQIMPPIMGVGAFIMADVTGIPYVTIMAAAIVPALLFIGSLMIAAALQAASLGLSPVADERLEWNRQRLARGAILLVAFGSLLTLLFMGYPPTYAGFVATMIVLALAWLLPWTRPPVRDLWRFLADGGRDGLNVALACAAIGIVIGAITTTGLGVKLNQTIVAFGADSLLPALLVAALCSVILGMGLPTAASYLMVVFVAGPAITALGVGVLETHLFVFYYAVLSAITPPVALAVFAAAAITQDRPIPLSLTAIRLCFVGFLLPIIWIYHPEVMVFTLPPAEIPAGLLYLAALAVAIVGLSAANVGYFAGRIGVFERLLLLAGALAVIAPDVISTSAGVVLMLLLFFVRLRKVRHVETA